ncbi:hypothetical protein LCGC14_2043790 [marine sediment metagenome]|uniref:Uncharacterized protein n=1 Tax=marine sediment metagenome TaxID=412755 RepID=A0A0F9FDM7_9ZZZZ
MIKIRRFNEEFYDAIQYGDYHEIFVNPTKKELNIVYNEEPYNEYYSGIRFIAKNDTKKLYVFNSDLLHGYAIRKIFNENTRIIFDSNYQLLTGIIEGDDYTVTNSDSLLFDLKRAGNDAYMYLKFLLKTDWSWIDKYIYFSSWWETIMIPDLKEQLIKIEKGLEDID